MHSYPTIPALFHDAATNRPTDVFLRYLPDGNVGNAVELTYGELHSRALRVAGQLASKVPSGARVILLFQPGLEFAIGFYACILGGFVAVPAYPPDPTRLARSLGRLHAIATDCGAQAIVSTAFIREHGAALLAGLGGIDPADWVITDDPQSLSAAPFDGPLPGRDAIAFLQYTSGSTGTPRGVVIDHGNVAHNLEQLRRLIGKTPFCGWAPFYHDMGLIAAHFGPLMHGCEATWMSPLHFLRRPIRWLEVVSHYGCGATVGPTFGFGLTVRKSTQADLDRLDLSHLRTLVCSAEPARHAVLEAFARRFEPTGFRREALCVAYGLAESTLIVSASGSRGVPTLTVDAESLAAGAAVPAEAGPVLCSSGRGLEADLRIVGPEGRALPDRRVGEIWVASASVGRGYWAADAASLVSFDARLADEPDAGPFLRTGDLGFLDEGQLYVTGRAKDVIIVRGRNIYPQDVEGAAEASHAACRPGCSAAFAVDVDGEEHVGLAVELDPRVEALHESVNAAIREAVVGETGMALSLLVFLPKGALPKTSSGKLQRTRTAALLAAGELNTLARFDSRVGSSIRAPLGM